MVWKKEFDDIVDLTLRFMKSKDKKTFTLINSEIHEYGLFILNNYNKRRTRCKEL